ncbi:hypothetical protein ACJ41O_015128 [Fusarium nematophilum]
MAQDEVETGPKAVPETHQTNFADEKGVHDETPTDSDVDSNTGGLRGVEKMEALTQTWTKPWLIAAYLLIWLVFFTDSLQQQISNSLLPYVVSNFGLHGLMSATGIVSNLVSGVSKLPLVRIIDVIGRTQGLLIMLFCVVMSLILMAACTNVETYAAAQVFFWTGMNGIGYVLNIFMADTTTLKNRMILFGFTNTPYISNTFAGPSAAQAFLDGSTWRWGYGAFAIIIPVILTPLIAIFTIQLRRAEERGLYVKEKSNCTVWESIKYWVVELDLGGMIIIVAGFSLILLPFSLAGYQEHKWRSRFGSYLQVVYNLSVSKAGYITNIYNIVSCGWGVPVGILLRITDRYKWLGLAMLPLQVLMTGLMIKFRMPDTPIGYVIMCEVLGSVAGGTFVMIEQIAVMASVPHRDVAVGIALLNLVTSVGGAIGQSISGAIWTNLMPSKLANYLPDELKPNALAIYGDITQQLAFPWGSPEREAIVRAYGETQKVMLIASVVALAGPIAWISLMKNHRLSAREQTKGLLF